jgi:hypothetical protein
MNKKDLSERDICSKFVGPAIKRAGWDGMMQIREEVNFTKGRIIVRGKLVTRGKAKRADYILYYKPNIPIAIVEAKDNNHSVGDGMQQALDYAVTLNIPFVFSSNGDGFVFHDRTGTSMEKEATLSLDAFPSPKALWEKYRTWKGLTPDEEAIVLQDYFEDGSGKGPRYYQQNAINAAIEAIAKGQNRVQPDELFLIAFFQKAQASAFALQRVIAALELQHRTDARKGIGHDGNDRPVAQPFDIRLDSQPPAVLLRNLHLARHGNGIQQFAHLIGLQNRRDADLPAESRPLHEHRRVIGNDLLDHEPVEQSPQRRQVLFDRGSGERLAFDIGGYVERPYRPQLQLVRLAPAEELLRRLHVSRARVLVADGGCEEFEEVLAGFLAGIGNDCR